jgi:hypothetical protein
VRKHAPWIAAALLALVGAGWWFGSPWWTLYRMREAARARDVGTLSEYIDYRSVLLDAFLRNQRELARKGVPGMDQSRSGRIAMESRVLANLITMPERLLPVLEAGSSRDDSYGMRFEDLELRHADLDEFRLVQKNGKGGELIFRRHGLSWKLSTMHLPAQAPALTIQRKP